jgi:hypothetical protein
MATVKALSSSAPDEKAFSPTSRARFPYNEDPKTDPLDLP